MTSTIFNSGAFEIDRGSRDRHRAVRDGVQQ